MRSTATLRSTRVCAAWCRRPRHPKRCSTPCLPGFTDRCEVTLSELKRRAKNRDKERESAPHEATQMKPQERVKGERAGADECQRDCGDAEHEVVFVATAHDEEALLHVRYKRRNEHQGAH